MKKPEETVVGVDSGDEGDLSFLAPLRPMNTKNIFFHDKTVNFVFLVVAIFAALLRIVRIDILISETALHYFHSSVAQSMAAIIALVGTFAVFRYSFLLNKLKNCRVSLKEKFKKRSWEYNLGITESDSWSDDEVLPRAEEYSRREGLSEAIKKEMTNAIIDIKIIQIYVNDYINYLRRPAISSFTTFILSILLIPMSGYLASGKVGLFSVISLVFLTTITSINIYKYFVTTATYEKRG